VNESHESTDSDDTTNIAAVPRRVAVLAILLGVLCAYFVALPAREATIVCLVRGPQTYFTDGVRIRWARRHSHFTTGETVPSIAEIGVTVAALFLPGYVGYILADGFFRLCRFSRRNEPNRNA
jgi:hypothetical protein